MSQQRYLLGAHVSIAGGLWQAIERAVKDGMNTFQIFSRNPRGWNTTPLTNESIKKFIQLKNKHEFTDIACHMPYLPNLIAPNPNILHKSKLVLLDELKRCAKLEIPYLVTHIGHHKGEYEKGFSNLISALQEIIPQIPENVWLLLENTAGEKNSIGSHPNELNLIFRTLEENGVDTFRLGICFDTCHAFAAGYDLRTKTAINDTIKKFTQYIPLEKIRVIHVNDAKQPLGSGKDRHENIGKGYIGINGFKALLNHPLAKGRPLILETPVKKGYTHKQDLEVLLYLLTGKTTETETPSKKE